MTHFKKPSLYKDVPYTATNSSTMSNGEVKRWYVYSSEDGALYAVSKNQRGFVPDASTIEVMPVEDHERIVAEKDAEIEKLQRKLEGQWKRNGKLVLDIATQKRVIEKLREQRDIELEDNCWDDALTGGRPFEQARAMMDAEIEAIEKGS